MTNSWTTRAPRALPVPLCPEPACWEAGRYQNIHHLHWVFSGTTCRASNSSTTSMFKEQDFYISILNCCFSVKLPRKKLFYLLLHPMSIAFLKKFLLSEEESALNICSTHTPNHAQSQHTPKSSKHVRNSQCVWPGVAKCRTRVSQQGRCRGGVDNLLQSLGGPASWVFAIKLSLL